VFVRKETSVTTNRTSMVTYN